MPLPQWPQTLHPPVQYRLCWRCGGNASPGKTPRLCSDCRSIVRNEQAIWDKTPRSTDKGDPK